MNNQIDGRSPTRKYYCVYRIGQLYLLGLGKNLNKAKTNIKNNFSFFGYWLEDLKFIKRVLLSKKDIKR